MLKLCGEIVLPLLELIFKSCLESSTFPSEWVKDNESLKDNRAISLLPIWKKYLND